MAQTVFKKVDYDLDTLMKFIELGEIGLPDIQRPFVWKNNKVRDLFDSMYRGYPVGYLLLWQNGLADDRTIGTDAKQKPPKLVIVDGQQRLTSLYAVIKDHPVVRGNYTTESIHIAFNPLEETFEVTDAAIRRDRSYIPDISVLWSSETDVFEVVDGYLDNLAEAREVTEEETRKVRKAVQKLQSLLSFPFTALELVSDIDEEDVSEVFVRINSKGTELKQSDFILTLMSVFWDEGRAELERFCRDSREPSKGQSSPFNYYLDPYPDQLLRVDVGLGFKRARLKYVYSILRGKNLETGEFSDERRIAQFEVLKRAQDQVLDLQHWHDFLACIRQAGFRSHKMISSNNNLIFSYILYLIGRTEYGVEEFTLRRIIAQWFYMSAVTGRFTGSPESAMEYDLAQLREIKTPEQFIGQLEHICDITLTNDYWAVTLPNDLATSSSRSPSLFAYNAALVLLGARALFSSTKIADLLDPSLNAKRKSVERHHLFPKAHLRNIGISGRRQTNQIANYAYMEWHDNTKVGDTPPAEYVPRLKERFSETESARMYHHHALPEFWERMEYPDFLEMRRELMARVIQEGYLTLRDGAGEPDGEAELDLPVIIESGESAAAEFKSTLRVNLHTGKPDKRMELAVLKTIAGFLNTNGGTLIIGVADDGTPVGIEIDQFPNEDKMSLHLINIVKARIGVSALSEVHLHFEDYRGSRVLVVRCKRSASPVFVVDDNQDRFYVRTGPSTSELRASQHREYIQRRFGR